MTRDEALEIVREWADEHESESCIGDESHAAAQAKRDEVLSVLIGPMLPITEYSWCFGKPHERHDFRFLRRKVEDEGAVNVQNEPNGAPMWQMRSRYIADVFYCTKCLAKREIPA